MMQNAIALEGVTRRFGDVQAVHSLTFTVEKGEIFGLLGPNGAGKTTTINMIVGLLRRHGGQIQVLGFDPMTDARQVRRCIGLVPQHTNLYEDLNALDNLWHHAALYCSDLSVVQQRIADLLDLVDLWPRRRDAVRTYSGGMKRRLAFARALLHDPDIILFDEPTLGVDVQGRHVLWQHIKDQAQRGKTFIISTNNMTEADILCERLVIIDHGSAIALDNPEALKSELGRDIITLRTKPNLAEPQVVFSGLGVSGVTRPQPDVLRLEVLNAETILAELITRVTSSYQLEAINVARPTLDDVFLYHTGKGLRD